MKEMKLFHLTKQLNILIRQHPYRIYKNAKLRDPWKKTLVEEIDLSIKKIFVEEKDHSTNKN